MEKCSLFLFVDDHDNGAGEMRNIMSGMHEPMRFAREADVPGCLRLCSAVRCP